MWGAVRADAIRICTELSTEIVKKSRAVSRAGWGDPMRYASIGNV